jgi:phage major head subunit gpT-like protein
MIVAGQKEIFTKNFDSFPVEYTSFVTEKTSNKQTETYDSMGNLGAATLKPEGTAINYGKVTQAYQTSITNRTYSNGYSHSFEAIQYDQYGVINSVKAKELARTMKENEENIAIAQFDNAFTTNLADGVPLCSLLRPCLDAPGVFNQTIVTASSLKVPENHKTMIKAFSAFKNHAGGKMKSYPNQAMTHYQNMLDIEEIYGSEKKANEI